MSADAKMMHLLEHEQQQSTTSSGIADASLFTDAIEQHGSKTASIAVSVPSCPSKSAGTTTTTTTTAIDIHEAHTGDCDPDSLWEVASLSKPIGTAFAHEYFAHHGIAMDARVNTVLEQVGSAFRIKLADDAAAAADNNKDAATSWPDELTLEHLCSHAGLNMHYVCGVPADHGRMLSTDEYLEGNSFNPTPVRLIFRPGTAFKYSGAGFILLQYILEKHSGKSVGELTRPWLDALGLHDFTFESMPLALRTYVEGKKDDGNLVDGGHKMFPAFAAGGFGTMRAMHKFLVELGRAFHRTDSDEAASSLASSLSSLPAAATSPMSAASTSSSATDVAARAISRATARRMLVANDRDFSFMGCHMGVGIFVLLSSDGNRFMLHQGANDGFRVLCFHCYDGVDAGKGFTVAVAGDVDGVLFNCAVAREAILRLQFAGVDVAKLMAAHGLSTKGLKQEEIVNIGYRNLLFSAFAPPPPPLPLPLPLPPGAAPGEAQEQLLATSSPSANKTVPPQEKNIEVREVAISVGVNDSPA